MLVYTKDSQRTFWVLPIGNMLILFSYGKLRKDLKVRYHNELFRTAMTSNTQTYHNSFSLMSMDIVNMVTIMNNKIRFETLVLSK
jgi:hypothetical protein